MATYKEIKKAMAAIVWPLQQDYSENFYLKRPRFFYVFALHQKLQNIQCKFQIMTSWPPCGPKAGYLAQFGKPCSKIPKPNILFVIWFQSLFSYRTKQLNERAKISYNFFILGLLGWCQSRASKKSGTFWSIFQSSEHI